MKKILILILTGLSFVFAQNIMTIDGRSGNPGDTILIVVDIDNVNAFVGFQFDLKLSDQVTYVEGSAELSYRITDHQVVDNLYGSDSLTIFAYSMSNDTFTGTTGEVLRFNIVLGTVPGDYVLTLLNATIANAASENILTGTTNGTFYITAPDINISPTAIDYGRVPLLETLDQSFTIQNNGNDYLTISSITSDLADFEVTGSSSFTLGAGNSQSVTVRFHSNTKGIYEQQVTVVSDDPDEPSEIVDLSVIAYAVNELNVDNIFGRSGYVSTLSFDISNMEPFVAFSFDLDIPEAMRLVEGSALLTERKTDHAVSATTLENGNIRVVAYSPGNEAFTGTSGDVLTIDFLIDGLGGYYSINFVDPVIGDAGGNNIISDDYGGTLEIAAPDIDVNPSSFDFGEVSIFDTLTLQPTFYNHGSDTLHITQMVFYDPHFYSSQALPLTIYPGENTVIPVSFHKDTEDDLNSTLRIRSNDPNEDPLDISLSATSFIPNIMRIDSSEIVRNDTGWVHISIENNEAFVGFQCDVNFPEGFTYLEEVSLSDRAGDHSITSTEKSGNIVSVFSYSMSQDAFSGEEGVVASLKFLGPSDMDDYTFTLSDVIIANSASENVTSSCESGIIEVTTSGPVLSAFPSIHINEDEDTLFNISSLVYDPNSQFKDLIWTFTNNDPISLSVINEDLFIVAETDWFGSRTVTVEVDDNELQDETTFTVTFDPVNDAPIAYDGSEETNEETSLEFALDATDVDAVSLNFTVIDLPLHGDLSGTAPDLTYLPEENYNGYDSLRFKVDDGELSDTATVLIEVLPINDRPHANYQLIETKEDTLCPVTLTGTDPEDDPFTFEIFSDPYQGTLSGTPPSIVYTPNTNYYGEDSFRFLIIDNSGAKDTGTVDLVIQPVNDPPVAIAGSDQTDEETSLEITLTASDVDNDSETLIFAVVDSTLHGCLEGTAPYLTYVPDVDYNGEDSLIFSVSDGQYCDTAKFDIEVIGFNDPPVWACLPDTSFDEDDSLKVHLSKVVNYLSDADDLMEDLVLSYEVPEVFHYGLIDSVLYLTADTNWYGEDSISIQASDGTDSASVTWHITVLPVNDAPEFTSFIENTLYFDADCRDTTLFSELFTDIDTPDSLMNISIVSRYVQYEILTSKALMVLYIDDNTSVSEYIRITLNDGDNRVSDYLHVEVTEVAIDPIPQEFALHAPYPNPFNPVATIPFDIPEIADVSIAIYDINGKKITTLVDGTMEAHAYRAMWNGTNGHGKPVSSGIYISRMTARSDETTFSDYRKLLFVK